MDLGFLNRYLPMIPKNDADWAAISQAQPPFQQKSYDSGWFWRLFSGSQT